MKALFKLLKSDVVLTGLAIFSMLFGAGNLMYPLKVGMESGDALGFGILGFIVTAVILPIAGFIGMMLFNGNYTLFFNRLGKPVGSFLVACCMLVIGPLIALPRITTLSHTMIAPFLPFESLQALSPMSSCLFALIFLGIMFLLTFKENRIVDVLGAVISPLLIISLAIIIIKGLIMPGELIHNSDSSLHVFTSELNYRVSNIRFVGCYFLCLYCSDHFKKQCWQGHSTQPTHACFIGP